MDSLAQLPEGIIITPLKIIYHPSGDIYHAMKKTDAGYSSFGESYFSTVKKGEIKGWKKHTEMTLNLLVPVGEVQFVFYNDRKDRSTCDRFFSINLSPNNYHRLTVSPNIWFAFKGIGDGLNLINNIASIAHDPSEVVRKNLEEINYSWK